MVKLQLTGQNVGPVLNFGSGHFAFIGFMVLQSVKLLNLKLKTRPKQLLGYVSLATDIQK
jgi:hypothetical protein